MDKEQTRTIEDFNQAVKEWIEDIESGKWNLYDPQRDDRFKIKEPKV